MPEKIGEDGKYPLSKSITSSMHDWLAQEIESSGAGRNAVLDNFYVTRKAFMQRSDVSWNQNIRKTNSHYDRLVLWTPQFAENPADDFLTARQLFCAQMYLSGMFRQECFVVASDEAEYRFRRFGGQVLGVDINTVIENKLASQDTPVSLQTLTDTTLKTNKLTNSKLRQLHDRNRTEGTLFNYVRFLNSRGEWLKALSELQGEWLDLSVDYILHAAEVRDGDISKVPFLEPKSISDDPQIYYPFS
jgi:hypothetical protein